MSHDIRTPLNAVIGLTNLALCSPNDSKKVMECLQKIANSSQLLLGLINDVLDMSKIESGKMQLAETEFELGEWLAGVVTVTQSQTSVRGQHFDVNAWNITHELLCGDHRPAPWPGAHQCAGQRGEVYAQRRGNPP